MLKCSACHAHSDVQGASSLQLRASLRYFGLGTEAAVEAVLRQVERFSVSHYCLVEKLLLGVQAAHFKVVDGEFGVKAEPKSFQVGRASLCLFASGGDRAPDAAPRIELVTDIERKSVFGVSAGFSAAGHICRSTVGGGHRRGRDGRVQVGAVYLDERPSLAETRLGSLEALVGDVDP